MKYNEPRDWVHSARQYLGNVLLKAKKYVAAEKIFKEDLKTNPDNGWSLTGLALALRKENKQKEAAAIKQAAQKAFSGSDTSITASVY